MKGIFCPATGFHMSNAGIPKFFLVSSNQCFKIIFMLSQMRRLPLFVALAAFVLYACTMGSELTLNGLPLTSKLAGWDEIPMVGQPILWLITLPLQILPVALVPLALKLIAAVLASAILGLVTRTVQLLPWDHPWDGVSHLVCVIPILTACAVCGLDFSFWQEATSACGELLDLLLLAVALWLLLEYNARGGSRWLDAAAVLWGVGMAESWLMLVTMPLFVVGVIWIERLRFFRREFVMRLVLMGLAGFSIFFVLPMVNGLTPHSPWTLTQSWAESLHQTKAAILLPYKFWRAHRLLAVAVGISFLVPSIPLIVRMRDEGTRNKSSVDNFQLWIYRGLRLGLLLACFWLALDPIPGARQMVQKDLGVRLPMLTFDYLNALGAAFLMGNLLLISQTVVRDDYRRSRSGNPWREIAGPVAAAGLGVVVVGLLTRNAPAIVHSNYHPLEEFGDLAVSSLPAGRGAVLGDYPEKLKIFRLALDRRGMKDWVAVDTHALASVKYRAQLEQKQPAGWLTDKTRHELTPFEALQLLREIASTNRLFYLPPSYGHFFEGFYAVPVGTLYELKPRGKDPLDVPALTTHDVEANEQLWTGLWSKELSSYVLPRSSSGWGLKMAKLGLVPPSREQDRVLGDWISIPLDAWAVALQTHGHLKEAQVRLEESLQLNTNNISSRITLACNTNLQEGVKLGLQDVEKVAGQLGNPDKMTNILSSCGPFDEPTLDYLTGSLFYNHGLFVEAAEQLERARMLAPGALAPELALAETYNQLQMPDRSRSLISHVREEIRNAPTNSALDLDLALLESNSWLMQTNVANAVNILNAVVKEHPDDREVSKRVLAAYVALNDITNALNLVEGELSRAPDDVPALDNKAIILMQAGRAADALPVLDRILILTNQPEARVNRAFAQIAIRNYALAKTDLHALEKQGTVPAMVDFGLALLAEHDTDTNAARRYLHMCLSNTPPGVQLWRQANAHLLAIEPAGGK